MDNGFGLRTNIFDCKLCGECFKSDSKLQEHIESSTSCQVSMFYCNLCSRLFPTKKLLKRHTSARWHRQQLSHRCQSCDQQFADRMQLERHCAASHAPIPKTIKYVSHLPDLTRHEYSSERMPDPPLNLHSNFIDRREKPFTCSLCDMKFATEGIFKIHLIISHFGRDSQKIKLSQSHAAVHPTVSSCRSNNSDRKTSTGASSDESLATPSTGNCVPEKRRRVLCTSEQGDVQFESWRKKNAGMDGKPTQSISSSEIQHRLFAMTESDCHVKCEVNEVIQCEELTADEAADVKPLLEPDDTVDSILKNGFLPGQRRSKLYHCQECDEAFATAYWLKAHIVMHDNAYTATSSNRFVCKMCTKVFKSASDVQEHSRHHFEEQPYHCQDCDRKFLKAGGLIKHTRLHYTPQSHFKHLQCKICDRVFLNPKFFDKHMKRHNMPSECQKMCGYCSLYFRNALALKRHKLFVHSALAQRCKVCGRAFVHTSHLKLHMRLHTDDKPYECTYCGEKFAWTSALRSHELMHPEVFRTRIYGCDLCGRDFQSSWSLKKHERWHREKPDACEICGLMCSTTIELKRHKLVHMTDREFECDICKMRFTTPSNLEIHMLSHFRRYSSQLFTPAAPIVRKQSYQCNQCDRIFCNPASMRRHAIAHACNQHSCEVCGRSYLNVMSLNVHRSKNRHFVPNPQIRIGTSRRGPVPEQLERRSILLANPLATQSTVLFEGWKKRSERTSDDSTSTAPAKQQFEGWKRKTDRTDNNTSTPTVEPVDDKSLLDIPPIVIAPQLEVTAAERSDLTTILIEPDDIKEEPA